MAFTSTVTQPMKGGDGPYSYSQNSLFQRGGVETANALIKDAIMEKLDLKPIISSSSPSKCFAIADLGCSVGPNTFIAVQNIIESIKLKHQSYGPQNQDDLEFQVFFSDLPKNDFNTLFMSLPSDRQYFAAGVPGCFRGPLFPMASLHFVHTSYALHWLSSTPKELTDEKSPAFNKGRIDYYRSSKEVFEAYTAQYTKDMESFLSARADELVVGGLMAIVTVCLPNNVSISECSVSAISGLLEASLLDMVKEGLISEEKVDSFNMPRYHATPRQLENLIEKNGCFSIERTEQLVRSKDLSSFASNSQMVMAHVRAAWEGLIKEHFGAEIVEEVFDRFLKKIAEASPFSQSSVDNKPVIESFLLLKRV